MLRPWRGIHRGGTDRSPGGIPYLHVPRAQPLVGTTAWRSCVLGWLGCAALGTVTGQGCSSSVCHRAWGSSILSPVVPTSLGTRTGIGFVSPGCRHWLVSSQAPFYGLLFEPEELCCICKTHRCNRGNSLPNWIGTAWSNWLFGSSRFKSSCARLNKFVRLYQLGKLCWRGDLLNDLPCF